VWLCFVLCSRTFYPFCRVEHPTKGKISIFCAALTRRWQKQEGDSAKQNWRAAGALRIFRFFLVYVD
jgi:hypothetical protein